MGARRQVGRGLEATLGKERTSRIRAAELRLRRRLADRLAPPPPPKPQPQPARKAPPAKKAPLDQAAKLERRRARLMKRRALGEIHDRRGGWLPSDPYVEHPEPPMSRHRLLLDLHRLLTPRTYVEIGVNQGASLSLSRATTVAVDPAYLVDRPLHCDLDLVRETSDDFFARPDPMAHLDGVPVDLAFIDGMHLSEYVLRDFTNLERHLAPTAVTVIDDVLPRNGLEAARQRLTNLWAGDVYKAAEIVARRRPDLLVLFVNTSPTGTALVIGADPGSSVLADAYADELAYLEAEDPQEPPQDYLSRAVAVDPEELLASEAWGLIVAARRDDDAEAFERARDVLRAIPRLGARTP